LANVVVIQVIGSIKDEWTFNTLNFIKSKLTRFTNHLDLVIQMLLQENNILKNFPHDVAIQGWKAMSIWYGFDA
jgi:hypothetical protein